METSPPAPVVTKDILVADLARLGIVRGDVLFVHSSLKSIGQVDGGAEAVIDALLEVVGSDGLLAVPTLTKSSAHPWAPDPTWQPLPFHPAKTPSRVGMITETLRLRPNAVRSHHPTHSVAAIGPAAGEMTAFHGLESHFGRHTPYGWLVRHGAKILLLGVGNNANTLIHAVEEIADMPSLLDNEVVVEDADGRIRQVVAHGSPAGCRDFYSRRTKSKAEKAMRAKNIIRDGLVGQAPGMVIDSQAQELVLLREVYGSQPDILCCDRPECGFCQKVRSQLLLRHAKGR